MICGDSVSVYALENESLSDSFVDSKAVFHCAAFRKYPGCSEGMLGVRIFDAERYLTSSDLLYPFIHFLQAESSFGATIIFILVDMENLLVGAGQSSSNARSVRLDQDFAAN